MKRSGKIGPECPLILPCDLPLLNFGTLVRTETTFGHLFKQAGYATGICGKWQLGHEKDSPQHFGFDESCLWQQTRRPPRYANPGLEYNGVEKDFKNGEYGPTLVNDFALDFIARNQKKPFFLYYPMILTHNPFQPTPDSADWDPTVNDEKHKEDSKHFADMTACGPSRASFMRGRYFGSTGDTLGEHFIAQGSLTARVGKIFHMRVPGDIIAGSDGEDVAACWTERYNSVGQEAHTPGDYACLNLNVFTTTLEGRQSTGDPHRPFVTVTYEGDGSDQPDAKTAAKSIELLRKFSADEKPFLLAVGFVRPHYPMVAPRYYFDQYPYATSVTIVS